MSETTTSIMAIEASAAAATRAVTFDRRGPAAWIRIARPEQRNALNPAVLEGLESGLARAAEEGARAVVLTGTGSTFSAGADLAYVLGAIDEPEVVERLLERASALTRTIEHHPAPVIAAVNGHAIAGGLELVLACDLVIAAQDATLADGHANFGLFPGAGSTVRLPRIAGRTRALHLMLTGRAATADEMRELGVVNEVVPADRLEPAVQELCESLARTSPEALARMKRVVHAAADLPVDEGLALELATARQHLRSPAVVEGLRRFAAAKGQRR